MSPRDLPLWARMAAAALVIVASWWLTHTAVARDTVGASVGPLGAGVVAAFVLRGTNLPLGLWPDGPLRRRFQPGWVLGVVLVFAGLLLVANPATSPPLSEMLDRGTYAAVVIGTVAWGFAVAFVRQRGFLIWMAAAVLAGVTPAAVGTLTEASSRCAFAMDASLVPCEAGMLQAAAFTAVVTTAIAPVTLELAFRRMILGRAAGAGLVLVLLSAAASAAWFAVMEPGVGLARIAWWAFAGVGAAALYAGSGSLLVSSLYMGLLGAGEAALRLGTVEFAAPGTAMLATHGALAVFITVLVGRRNGLTAGLVAEHLHDALEAPADVQPREVEEA